MKATTDPTDATHTDIHDCRVAGTFGAETVLPVADIGTRVRRATCTQCGRQQERQEWDDGEVAVIWYEI